MTVCEWCGKEQRPANGIFADGWDYYVVSENGALVDDMLCPECNGAVHAVVARCKANRKKVRA